MKIQLKKCDMQMKCQQCEAIFTLTIPVELWKDVGLAIHETTTGWRVSHYSSGKAIIKGIPDRTTALKVMVRLHKEVLQDWTTSESHLRETAGFGLVKEKMNSIQKEYVHGNKPSSTSKTEGRQAVIYSTHKNKATKTV